jgi:hypothetical protein
MFLYCPNNIDLVLYYNVSYVISYMLGKCGHFIFIKNTQHYLWTLYIFCMKRASVHKTTKHAFNSYNYIYPRGSTKISSFCGKIVTAFITTNITTCINWKCIWWLPTVWNGKPYQHSYWTNYRTPNNLTKGKSKLISI